MKINFIFAWYDLWVGAFWDKRKRWLYILPVPTIGIILKFDNMDRVSLTREEFYDKVAAALKEKGYEKAPDMDTVIFDYEADLTVEKSVEQFSEEWGDPAEEELD